MNQSSVSERNLHLFEQHCTLKSRETSGPQQQTMSLAERMAMHLQEYRTLVQSLLHTSAQASSSATNTTSETGNVQHVMSLVLRKDGQLQGLVKELIDNQRRQATIASLRKRIVKADHEIIGLARQLSVFEQTLFDIVSDHKTLKSVDRVSTTQRFSAHEVLVLAEELGMMSTPPAELTERRGASLVQPPAPQEQLMQQSLLNRSLQDLVQGLEQTAVSAEPDSKQAVEAPAAPPPSSADAVLPDKDSFQPGDVVSEAHLRRLHDAQGGTLGQVTLSPSAPAATGSIVPMLGLHLNPDLEDVDSFGSEDDDDNDSFAFDSEESDA